MTTHIVSAAPSGLSTTLIHVEVDRNRGLPKFTIVGLPDTAVQESKERVRAALKNSGLPFPEGRVTVNLAPGHVRKSGPLFDVPIALGLVSVGKKVTVLPTQCFVGELSLDGRLGKVRGLLGMLLDLRNLGIEECFVPEGNRAEASLISGLRIYPCQYLNDIIAHLTGEKAVPPCTPTALPLSAAHYDVDLSFVSGQHHARRGLEISAAGHHHVLFSGPPGSGKTLLASALPSILPPLAPEEVLEVTRIYSLAGFLQDNMGVIVERPFRKPHHSASAVALIGGGQHVTPGEVTLAHRGVLFLDELLEFPRSVLNHLRGPLEDRMVTVARAEDRVTYPADCMVVGAMNPCPCGYLGDTEKACTCSTLQILSYQRRLSGPLLDRFDCQIHVPRIALTSSYEETKNESSESVRARVVAARAMQIQRFGTSSKTNSTMNRRDMKKYAALQGSAHVLLDKAIASMHLSPRVVQKTVKVARTIADLDARENVTINDIAESLHFRSFDDTTVPME